MEQTQTAKHRRWDATAMIEQTVIRGLIAHSDYQTFAILRLDDFTTHQQLYTCVHMVWRADLRMTRTNIVNMIRQSILMDVDKIIAQLDNVLEYAPPTLAELTHYAGELHKTGENRRFSAMIKRVNTFVDLGDIDAARAEMDSHNTDSGLIVQTMAEAKQAMLDYDEKIQSGELNKINFGIDTLDRATGGIQPEDLVVFMAPTGGGKSSFAYKLLLQFAEAGHSSVFVSGEISARSIMQNSVSIVSRLPMTIIRGYKTPEQIEKRNEALEHLQAIEFMTRVQGIAIDPKQPDITIEKVKEYVKHNTPDVLIIDYLQLIGTDIRVRSRFDAITHIMRVIQQISVAYCPVFLLVQYNREGLKSKDASLYDGEGSSAIEKSATTVIQGNSIESDSWIPSPAQDKQRYLLRVTKNRNGTRGRTMCWFDAPYKTFSNMNENQIKRFIAEYDQRK